MSTITIDIDDATATRLGRLSQQTGTDVSALAANMLRRAARRPLVHPTFDAEEVRAAYLDAAEEDLALAESDLDYRNALLTAEDMV